MASLASLSEAIKSNLDRNRPPLQGTPIDRPVHWKALEAILRPDTFLLQDAVVDTSEDAVRVRGNADLLGLMSTPVVLGFRSRRQRVDFFVDVPVALTGALGPLAALGAPIEQTAFHWQLGPIALDGPGTRFGSDAFYHFTGRLRLGDGLELPIKVAPTPEAGRWRLTGDFDAVPLSELAALLRWFAGGRALPPLPGDLDRLAGLQICNFSAGFDTEKARIEDAALTIATSEAWPLIKDRLILNGVSLSLGYGAGDAESGLSVALNAAFELSGQAVPISAVLADGHVRLAMQANNLQLPGIKSLLDLAGRQELMQSVPPPIAAVSELAVRALSLDIDAASGGLTRLDAQIGSLQPVGPIQGVTLESTEIDLSVEPGSQPPLTVTLRALMAAGDEYCSLFGQLDDALRFSGFIEEVPLTDLAKQFVPDLPPALGNLRLHGVDVQFSSAGNVEFSAGVSWDIHAALEALGLPPLPEGTASIELSRLEFAADMAAKSWRLNLSPANTIEFPATGAHRIAMSAINVEIANDGMACRFTLDGDAVISDALGISATAIRCSCESASKQWRFSGDLTVRLLGQNYPFTPRIDVDARSARFLLAYARELPLSPWPDCAAVTARDVTIGLSKEDARDGYRWIIEGKAHFDIAGGFIVANGDMRLANGGVELRADIVNNPTIELSAIPGTPRITVYLDPLQLTLAGKDMRALSAAGTVSIKGMPPPANAVFPDGTSAATLKIDQAGFAMAFKPLADPTLAIRFLDVHLPSIVIEQLLLRQTTTASQKKQWQLGAALHVDGLARLNGLFGNADLFEDSVKLIMTVGQGVSMALNGPSPLKPVKLRPPEDDGSVWTEWVTVRDTGQFSFKVPDFAFDFKGGRWHASGGVESRGEPTLPLGLIRRALAPINLDALFAAMPDKLPLSQLDLTSKDLYDQIERMLGGLPTAAATVFRRFVDLLQAGLRRLPKNMYDEYLRLNLPGQLTFDMSVEPTGGYAFGLRTQGDPLRLLLPWLFPTGPGLLGATMHHLSLGLSGGGSVAVLKADAYFDQFDAPGLIYALLTDKGHSLCNRLELRKTTALIPLAAPVPLPLFYRRFGWSYKDFLGIQLEAHAAFGPTEEPPLGDWITLIAELVEFFTDETFYLHDHDIPRSMQLPFKLYRAYLALPDYLGGGTLGCDPDLDLPTFPVAETLAKALDGIKARNVGWIIQSVPLKWPKTGNSVWIRVGHETVSFGPLSITAAWCITTKDEFVNEVLPDPEATKHLAVANAGSMLDSLPGTFDGGRTYDRGYVILLMGALAAKSPLAEIFEFTCQFGIAAMGPKDFETGLRLKGRFGPGQSLVLGIEGRIKTQDTADGESIVVSVYGDIYLIVAGQRLALSAGLTIVPGRSFEGFVTLELSKNLLTIGGTLTVDAGGAAIDGHVHWTGVSGPAEGFATGARFCKDGILFRPFTVKIGGFECGATLHLPGKRTGDVFTIGVAIILPAGFADAFAASLKAVADETVTRETSDAFDLLESLREKTHSFEASLRGLQAWLPDLCAGIINQINDGVSDASVDHTLDRWAGKDWRKRWAAKGAKPTARKKAKERAAPWITKLRAVHDAAAHTLDESYRERLKDALTALVNPNEITISTGKILSFPGITVFSRKPLLNSDQMNKVNQAIDAIGKLPETSEKRVDAEAVFSRLPTKQKVLANVRHAVDKGIEQGIPGVSTVGFETSVGLLKPGETTISAVLSYPDRPPVTVSVEADLTRPDLTAMALSKAFATML